MIQEHWTRARVMLFTCNLPNNLWPEAVFYGNWLGSRLSASRIDGEIPLKLWNPEARINYTKLLEFGTSVFAYIYRDDNIKGNKLLPRSVFACFVRMASDFVLIKVFIPQTEFILHLRMNEFRIQDKTGLPGAEILLDGIAKPLAKEQEEAKAILQEAHLVNEILSTYTPLPQCLVAKKNSIPAYQ